MDHDREIYSLSAQALAFEAVLTQVFYRISSVDPRIASAIAAGFDDAANFVENVAIEFGETTSPEHTVKAIRIVEELRAAVIGNQKKPRHGV